VSPTDGAPSLNYTGGTTSGYQTMTFTLTDDADTINIGGLFTLKLPANAVCTLDSPYGPAYWDTPCTTLGWHAYITVTATYGMSNTGPEINFSPEIRFSPSTKVTVSTSAYARTLTSNRSYYASHPWALKFVGMYLQSTLTAPLVPDAINDVSLTTHINLWSGNVWRRIKHFSGYNVATGDMCTSGTSGCSDTPPPIIDY
jgi:hypothetical protein